MDQEPETQRAVPCLKSHSRSRACASGASEQRGWHSLDSQPELPPDLVLQSASFLRLCLSSARSQLRVSRPRGQPSREAALGFESAGLGFLVCFGSVLLPSQLLSLDSGSGEGGGSALSWSWGWVLTTKTLLVRRAEGPPSGCHWPVLHLSSSVTPSGRGPLGEAKGQGGSQVFCPLSPLPAPDTRASTPGSPLVLLGHWTVSFPTPRWPSGRPEQHCPPRSGQSEGLVT